MRNAFTNVIVSNVTGKHLARCNAQKAVELPAGLRNNVAVLDAPNANGGTTKVYVMGVSHVSKIQAEQVEQLISMAWAWGSACMQHRQAQRMLSIR